MQVDVPSKTGCFLQLQLCPQRLHTPKNYDAEDRAVTISAFVAWLS